MVGTTPQGFALARTKRAGFTLVELLVVAAVLGLLASLLLPALAQGRKAALRSACMSQLRQQGLAWSTYLDDHEDSFPDRRDLKTALPGGYKPWNTWPLSDPRSGWAAVLLEQSEGTKSIWRCPAVELSDLAQAAQVRQAVDARSNAPAANYWMWRFDRTDDPVPADDFWGRTTDEAVISLRQSGNTTVGTIATAADVELSVDVYFPSTVPSVPLAWRGRSAHRGGRNRLLLDGHAAFLKDARTPRD